MKKAFNQNKILWIIFAVLTIGTIILQVLSFTLAYQEEAHYFKDDSILPLLSVLFAILAALVGTIASLRTKADCLTASPLDRQVNSIPTAFGFLLTAILLILNKNAPPKATLEIISIILLVLSALYSILVLFPKFRVSQYTVLLGFSTVLACIALTASFYFDATFEMNAPIKVTTQIALLFSMLFYTCELRYPLEKPQPRLMLILASWAIAIGTLAFPTAWLCGKLDRTEYAAGGILVFFLVISTFLKMTTMLFSAPTANEEPSQELAEFADTKEQSQETQDTPDQFEGKEEQ